MFLVSKKYVPQDNIECFNFENAPHRCHKNNPEIIVYKFHRILCDGFEGCNFTF